MVSPLSRIFFFLYQIQFPGQAYFPQGSIFGIQLIVPHPSINFHKTMFYFYSFSTIQRYVFMCKYVIAICSYFRAYSAYGLNFFNIHSSLDTQPLKKVKQKQ